MIFRINRPEFGLLLIYLIAVESDLSGHYAAQGKSNLLPCQIMPGP